ncbi:DUF6404 family protein [Escherichia coli]
MTFEQKKARAIALMDSKKMWRSNYAPPVYIMERRCSCDL